MLSITPVPCAAGRGHRDDAEDDRPGRDKPARGGAGPEPVLADLRARGQPMHELAHGQDEPGRSAVQIASTTPTAKNLAQDEERDGEEQEDAVRAGENAVDDEDRFFPGERGERRNVLDPVDVRLQELEQHLAGALREVGRLEQVREDVVPVEAHERVGVEEHRGHPRREHDVEGQVADHANGLAESRPRRTPRWRPRRARRSCRLRPRRCAATCSGRPRPRRRRQTARAGAPGA